MSRQNINNILEKQTPNTKCTSCTCKKERLEVDGLYLLKSIAVLMVVFLHTRIPFDSISLYWCCRTAVPIFFMISGFFCIEDDTEKFCLRLETSIAKIAKLTIVVNFVYLSWYMLWDGVAGMFTVDYFVSRFNEFIINGLLTGNEYSSHLWYLTSYLHVLIICWIGCKCKVVKYLTIVVPFGLLWNLSNGSYVNLLYGLDYIPSVYIHRNAISIGLPFFLIGGWIRRHQYILDNKWIKYLLLTALMVIQFVESKLQIANGLNPMLGDLDITTSLLAVCLVYIFLKVDLKNVFVNGLKFIGKRYTTNIYLWHPLVVLMYKPISSYVVYLENIPSYAFVYIVTLFISIYLRFIYKRFQKYVHYIQ